MEGAPPETHGDWGSVVDTLRRLHRLTRGWPQRPGWRSSTALLPADTGTRIDLSAMPPEAVARCRAAWARLADRPTCVVHGNPNSPANVRVTAGRVALIDWDEAHVDVADLELVLPEPAHEPVAPEPGVTAHIRIATLRKQSDAHERTPDLPYEEPPLTWRLTAGRTYADKAVARWTVVRRATKRGERS